MCAGTIRCKDPKDRSTYVIQTFARVLYKYSYIVRHRCCVAPWSQCWIMAYIPGYTFDIFISYSHVDNATVSGQGEGWIEQFYKNLNLLLAKRIGQMDVIRIWWDEKKLDGSKLFDQSIADGISQSAIMISLVSPGYLKSTYCQQELDLFYNKVKAEPVGPKIGDSSRLLHVLLNNIPFGQWPKELSGTTGFPFHDATDKEEFGDPLDTSGPQFLEQLKSLRDAIVSLFEIFLKLQAPANEALPDTVPSGTKPILFFAEVADTLRSALKRTMGDLEKEGYAIQTGIPPPDESAAHESRVKEVLEKADLSIHLLDGIPGKEMIDEPNSWYPQKQAELGLKYAKSTLIWVPSELDPNTVEEDNYRKFLQGLEGGVSVPGKYDYIRGAKSTLTQDISGLAAPLKNPPPPPVSTRQVQVLLDTHITDQLGAMDLGRILLESQIQPFINPLEDDPKENTQILSDRISQVSKLIFFYGKVSKDWVWERMNAALQLVIANNYPVQEFYIFMAPPLKDPHEITIQQKFLRINVIDNSAGTPADATALQQFIRDLKSIPA
jgi:hypothetical protein